ncbi:MAG TPA: site-2 protease family protein [Oligoflexia bacterium]|nr:site-2 protease family protein [Oligoflexia bacterium]HMP49414.1 site-2 protease family protein [Oligoflexia bacterium]
MSEAKSRKVPLGVILILLKLGPKFLSVLGKFLSVVFKTKVGLATVSYGSYAWLFTWQFAAVLMLSIGIHEAGHVWAMRRVGIKTRGFYFLPFVGGAAVMDSSFKSQRDHIFVALMGPIWGTAVALVALGMFLMTNSPLWAGLTAWIAALNLINLLPVHPLDGGRVLSAVMLSVSGHRGWYAICAVSAAFMLLCGYAGIWLFVLIGFFGFLEISVSARAEHYKRITLQSIESFLDALKALRVNAENLTDESFREYLISELSEVRARKVEGSGDLMGEMIKNHETVLQTTETMLVEKANEIRSKMVAPLSIRQMIYGAIWYFALVAFLFSLVWSMFSVDGAGEALKLFTS